MTDQMDGNAEQIRAIANQLAEAIHARIQEDMLTIEDVDERIEQAFLVVENKLNKKILTAVMANAVALIGIAFALGGLWAQFSDVPGVLDGRYRWMSGMEQRVGALEEHAERSDPSYNPPKPVSLPD